jgi:hypothetical protein
MRFWLILAAAIVGCSGEPTKEGTQAAGGSAGSSAASSATGGTAGAAGASSATGGAAPTDGGAGSTSTSTGGGGGGTGGAAGSGGSDAGSRTSCPTAEPAIGERCSVEGQACVYPFCTSVQPQTLQYDCVNGQWRRVLVSFCPPGDVPPCPLEEPRVGGQCNLFSHCSYYVLCAGFPVGVRGYNCPNGWQLEGERIDAGTCVVDAGGD